MRYPEINPELQSYIEQNVFPEYAQNDPGHQLGHIRYVIRRSLAFAKDLPDVNPAMAYVIASYHDICMHVDHVKHEVLGAERLQNDAGLRQFFSETEIATMSEAVLDHRGSNAAEPRSIYGKIVSSADRNTSIDAVLTRAYAYRIAYEPQYTTDETRIEACREHLLKKFGPNGYARQKMYFPDPEYERFCNELTELASDPERFAAASRAANHLA